MHVRSSAARDTPPRSTLLLYTDGLIENGVHDIDDGTAVLRDAFAKTSPDSSLDALFLRRHPGYRTQHRRA